MSTDYSSYATTTTTFSSAKKIKWETELLKKAAGKLIAERFATTKVVGVGEAGTIRFNKLLRLAKKTTQDTEGYAYGLADAKYLTTNYIDVTPTKWGESFAFTDDVSIEAFITDADNQGEIANQVARSMEYQLQKTIATGGVRHRIDKDATYQVYGTCDSGSSAIALKDNALTQSDDAWNGGYATIINPEGPAYDETSAVSDFVASTDVAVVAFTNALTTASKYRMTVGTGIAATDVMTTTAIMDVRYLHRKYETMPFDSGTIRAFIDADQERDLMVDSTWSNSAIYDDSGRFGEYQMVRWLGTEFFIGSELYREDVDGTENQASGVVHVAPFFGAKAYSTWRWGMGSGAFGVKFEYKDGPDSGDLRNNFKVISWKSKHASKVMRATSVINLMTGVTDYQSGL